MDTWSELNNPQELAEKLDCYEKVRFDMKKNAPAIVKKPYFEENIKSAPERKFKPPKCREVNQIQTLTV